MKMYCISDNIDTAVGLKLTGIEAVVVQEDHEVNNEIEKVLQDKEVGILIITDKIYEMSKEKFDNIKEKLKMPLLVKI